MTGINFQVLNENGKYNAQKDDIKTLFGCVGRPVSVGLCGNQLISSQPWKVLKTRFLAATKSPPRYRLLVKAHMIDGRGQTSVRRHPARQIITVGRSHVRISVSAILFLL